MSSWLSITACYAAPSGQQAAVYRLHTPLLCLPLLGYGSSFGQIEGGARIVAQSKGRIDGAAAVEAHTIVVYLCLQYTRRCRDV